MTEAQKKLKTDIEKIQDEDTIEKVNIFIMGILAGAKEKAEEPPKHTA
jgi:hypothetical protein